MSESERNGIKVLARAARILRLLQEHPAGLSLSNIAESVALPRSTVQRIVGALIDERLLTAASAKARVKLGPALVQLGSAADAGTERVIRPFMKDLSRATDETVDLSILRGDSAVFVEQVQGTQRLAAVSAIGMEFPLHCTANGKALLTLLPQERRQRMLAGRLKRYTDSTVLDPSVLQKHLQQVERSGLAYDLEEHTVGICAVGTAFIDGLGREYSLSIPVPAARFAATQQSLSKLLKKTKLDFLAHLAVVQRGSASLTP